MIEGMSNEVYLARRKTNMEPKTHFLAVNIKEVDSCVYLTKVVCS